MYLLRCDAVSDTSKCKFIDLSAVYLLRCDGASDSSVQFVDLSATKLYVLRCHGVTGLRLQFVALSAIIYICTSMSWCHWLKCLVREGLKYKLFFI